MAQNDQNQQLLLEQQLRQAQLEAQQIKNERDRMANPQYAEQARIDMYRQQRAQDLSTGQFRANEIFHGGLPKLEGGAIDEILQARRQQAQGFTAEEQNAMRDQNLGSLNSQNSADRRQQRIMQAAEGVRGARAVAQQNKLSGDQANVRAGMERDLFLKNIDAKRAGLDSLEKFEVDRSKYNNDQKLKELQGRMTTELGYGALGAADRGAAVQAVVGQQQADAARNQSGGGGGKK